MIALEIGRSEMISLQYNLIYDKGLRLRLRPRLNLLSVISNLEDKAVRPDN